MEKIRAAFFIDTLKEDLDGASITSHRIIEGIGEYIEPIFFTVLPPVNPDFPYPVYLAPYFTLPYATDYRMALPGKKKEFFKILDDFGPAFIHWSSPSLLAKYATVYSRERNIPNVTIYHSHLTSYVDYFSFIPFKKWVEKLVEKKFFALYDKANLILPPTDSMKKYMEDHLSGSAKVEIWGRGINIDRFNPAKRKEDFYGEENRHKTKILFVSRLVHYKETDLLIRVNQQFGEDKVMVLVGEGPEEEKMKNQMPNAVFKGKLVGEDLAIAYASADIFIFPSLTETFGNVVQEALASGLPAIVADAGGPADIVENEKTGYVIKPKDDIGFLGAIEKLFSDSILKREMSVNARSYAEKHSWPVLIDQLMKLYKSIL